MSSDDSASDSVSDDLRLRGRIDRSLRIPLLLLFTSAALWLVAAVVLGLLSAVALYMPELVTKCSGLQYGRLQPAHLNALVYGWAMQAGIGVAFWIMARLSRSVFRNRMTLLVMGCLWNALVGIGVLAVLTGWGTSIQWLDFPGALWPVMLLTYIFTTIWMLGLFVSREDKEAYISQFYILASLLWFPWIYFTANYLINHQEGAAVMKAGINGWYVSNMIYMVLAPIALAASFYIIPKVTGRALFSRPIANLGFWTLALFAGWTGMNRFMEGPLPAWMPALGGACTIFLLIPALLVLLNQLKTVQGRFDWTRHSPSLRFALFGSFAFVAAALLGAVIGAIPTGKTLQFTLAQGGADLVALYAFFSMTIFGAIYFIVPRLVGCEWPNGKMIGFHYWCSALGIVVVALAMIVAGVVQGHAVADPAQDFMAAIGRGKSYQIILTLGWLLILVSSLAFVQQLAVMACCRGRSCERGPTRIHMDPKDSFSDKLVAEEGAKA